MFQKCTFSFDFTIKTRLYYFKIQDGVKKK